MTQPSPDPARAAAVGSAPVPAPGDVPADNQETVRLDKPDPDATRPMSLADLLDSD
jgi:hypothetical protein